MEQLISFLREEFPENALDIQECIDLLNQSIGGSIESVKSTINLIFPAPFVLFSLSKGQLGNRAKEK